MLDGDLTVRSELGKGSTFQLRLPMELVGTVMLAPEDARRAVAVIRQIPDHRPRQLAMRVLLAEDSEESREIISLHLMHAGCRVSTADDGEEAHHFATAAAQSNDPFDVILMDMQMPVMDGYTTTSKLRAEGYQGVIIALTAHAMKEDRERCLRVGCDEYASKPVDIPALLALIERLCGRSGEPGGGAPVTDRLMKDPRAAEPDPEILRRHRPDHGRAMGAAALRRN